jgi:hypothetical protein
MKELFLKNPWFRVLIPVLLMVVANISGNALVFEISSVNEVNWALIPSKVSFYILIISLMIFCFYQIQIFKHDKELIKGFTPKQYEACIRNRVAEDVAKRSRKLIQKGEIDQLEKETDTFKKLYGENY